MFIETNDTIIETYLRYAQIEITGFCNMSCLHCRAYGQDKDHVTLEDVKKLFKFIKDNRDETFLLGISGGEPFLHPQLMEILLLAKNYGFDNITITTNGSLVTEEILDKLSKLNIKNLILQVSIDSANPTTHDSFRRFNGAHSKSIDLINRISKFNNVFSAIRTTITPETINEVEDIVVLAHGAGAKEITFSFVKPVGSAKDKDLTLSAFQRRDLVEEIGRLRKKYLGKISISSSDPLRVLLDPMLNNYVSTNDDELILGGCIAGIAAFNVDTNGNLTPCSMMSDVICNFKQYNDSEEIMKAYVQSPIVKNLAQKNFSGVCGKCKYKCLCGGCRAIAKCLTGDYMGSDTLCWYEKK